jgi:hypothetical protein
VEIRKGYVVEMDKNLRREDKKHLCLGDRKNLRRRDEQPYLSEIGRTCVVGLSYAVKRENKPMLWRKIDQKLRRGLCLCCGDRTNLRR